MPQIWATYVEIADALDQSPESVREQIHRTTMPRRKCSDGQTRVKLPEDLALLVLKRHFAETLSAAPSEPAAAMFASGPLADRIARLEQILSPAFPAPRTTPDQTVDDSLPTAAARVA